MRRAVVGSLLLALALTFAYAQDSFDLTKVDYIAELRAENVIPPMDDEGNHEIDGACGCMLESDGRTLACKCFFADECPTSTNDGAGVFIALGRPGEKANDMMFAFRTVEGFKAEGRFSLSDEQKANLDDGRLYVVVKSDAETSEARGQIHSCGWNTVALFPEDKSVDVRVKAKAAHLKELLASLPDMTAFKCMSKSSHAYAWKQIKIEDNTDTADTTDKRMRMWAVSSGLKGNKRSRLLGPAPYPLSGELLATMDINEAQGDKFESTIMLDGATATDLAHARMKVTLRDDKTTLSGHIWPQFRWFADLKYKQNLADRAANDASKPSANAVARSLGRSARGEMIEVCVAHWGAKSSSDKRVRLFADGVADGFEEFVDSAEFVAKDLNCQVFAVDDARGNDLRSSKVVVRIDIDGANHFEGRLYYMGCEAVQPTPTPTTAPETPTATAPTVAPETPTATATAPPVCVVPEFCPMQLGEFNLVVLNGIWRSVGGSDIQGRVLVCGDAELEAISIGDKLEWPTISGGVASRDDLVVSGRLVFRSGAMSRGGNIRVGNLTSEIGFTVGWDTQSGVQDGSHGMVILDADASAKCSDFRSTFSDVSAKFASWFPSATATMTDGFLRIPAVSAGFAGFLHIVDVAKSDIERAHTINIDIGANSFDRFVIRVRGEGSMEFKGKGLFDINGAALSEDFASRIIWHFDERITSLTIKEIGLVGSVVAVNADLNAPTGLISGQVIVKSFMGNLQINLKDFDDRCDELCPGEVEIPTALPTAIPTALPTLAPELPPVPTPTVAPDDEDKIRGLCASQGTGIYCASDSTTYLLCFDGGHALLRCPASRSCPCGAMDIGVNPCQIASTATNAVCRLRDSDLGSGSIWIGIEGRIEAEFGASS